jgi:hypothetical protein
MRDEEDSETKRTAALMALLAALFVTTSVSADENPFRIRCEIKIDNDLFDSDPPDYIACLVIEERLSDSSVTSQWSYHLQAGEFGQGGSPYTTYFALGKDEKETTHGYYSHLGEATYRGYYDPTNPDDHEPFLQHTMDDPKVRYCYYVVVNTQPNLEIGGEDPIAWAKTVNTTVQPIHWWTWNRDEYRYELDDQAPSLYGMVFNNFPHPQGKTQGPEYEPDYWPGDPNDGCHWDWYKHSAWPEVFPDGYPDYGHAEMVLEMLIDDWGTWDEMWAEHIQNQSRWVQ